MADAVEKRSVPHPFDELSDLDRAYCEAKLINICLDFPELLEGKTSAKKGRKPDGRGRQ